MDLDTHADDNTVLGDSCLLIHDTGQKVNVSGFSTGLGLIKIPSYWVLLHMTTPLLARFISWSSIMRSIVARWITIWYA